MTDHVKAEESQEQERVIGEIRAFEERLVVRSVKSSRRETVSSIVLFIVGSFLGFTQQFITPWLADIAGRLGIG